MQTDGKIKENPKDNIVESLKVQHETRDPSNAVKTTTKVGCTRAGRRRRSIPIVKFPHYSFLLPLPLPPSLHIHFSPPSRRLPRREGHDDNGATDEGDEDPIPPPSFLLLLSSFTLQDQFAVLPSIMAMMAEAEAAAPFTHPSSSLSSLEAV